MKATAGDSRLGGEDFDELLVNHIVSEFHRTSGGIDLSVSDISSFFALLIRRLGGSYCITAGS